MPISSTCRTQPPFPRGVASRRPGPCSSSGHVAARLRRRRAPDRPLLRRNVGLPTRLLTVSVIVRTQLGLTAELPVGAVADPTSQWAPTLPLPVVAKLLTVVDGGMLVRFRIRSTGAWLVDDVMLDPYSKR